MPAAPELQHHLAGLVSLADWIASDEAHFPYERQDMTDYYEERARPQARRAVEAAMLPAALPEQSTAPAGTDPLARAMAELQELRRQGQAARLTIAVPGNQDGLRTADLLATELLAGMTELVSVIGAQDDQDLGALLGPAVVTTLEQAARSLEPRRHAHLRAACRQIGCLVVWCPDGTDAKDRARARELLDDQERRGGHALLAASRPAETLRARPPSRQERIDRSVPFYNADRADNAEVTFPE